MRDVLPAFANELLYGSTGKRKERAEGESSNASSTQTEVLIFGDETAIPFRGKTTSEYRVVVNAVRNRSPGVRSSFTTVFSQHTPTILVLAFKTEEPVSELAKLALCLSEYYKVKSIPDNKLHDRYKAFREKGVILHYYGETLQAFPAEWKTNLTIRSVIAKSAIGTIGTMMKESEASSNPVILVYGDSNSWGMPHDKDVPQVPYENPWPMILQTELNNSELKGFRVADHTLCSRTTSLDTFDKAWVTVCDIKEDPTVFNGATHLNNAL